MLQGNTVVEPGTTSLRHKNGHLVPFPTLSTLQARIVLFSISVLCFACSWDGEFVFDDSEAIVTNKDLDSSRPLSDLLEHDFWGKKLTNTSHKSYRPLTVLTFRWNAWVSGGLHPIGFHIVNFILHGIVAIVLLEVFTLILNGPVVNEVKEFGQNNNNYDNTTRNGTRRTGRDDKKECISRNVDPFAFLCTLLFSVHPVHTESVAGIVGRADLLCALFFCLSFLAYVKGSTADYPIRPDSFSFPWLTVSAVLCTLATFSKEQGITVIGVCSAFDILSICQVDLGDVLCIRRPSLTTDSLSSGTSSLSSSSPQRTVKNHQVNWSKSLIKRQLFLAATAMVLLVMRWRIMGSSPPTFQVHDNPHSFVNGTVYRMFNYNYLYAINGWILLSPHWLCFDWSMGCVPTITSLTDPRIVVVFALWTALGLLAWACLRGLDKENARPLVLGIVLMVVPFLPATNLFFRVGFVVAERVLYLPSAGFCVVVCLGFRTLCQWPNLRKRVMVCFLLLLVVLCARSVQRSLHWRTEMTLFKEGEHVCPLNAKVHYNIAKLNGDAGNNEVAKMKYRKAIELNSVYDQAMNNLANILKDEGHLLESEALLDKAVEITPTFSSAWMNRGITKSSLKKYEEGEESYRRALQIRRNYPDCYYNLGNLYLEMKRHQDALTAFRNATALKPKHWNSWNNAMLLLDNLGHLDQAIKMGLQALQHLPDQPNILYSMGNAYGKTDDYVNSEKYFLKAIKADPNNANVYQNLGVLYHRWNKYELALEYYQKAYQKNPHSHNLLDNMNMLKRKMNSKK